MIKCLVIILIFILSQSYAGGYIANESVYDSLYSRNWLYWILLFWICFWGWLSSRFSSNNDKKKADLCAYICLGFPFLFFLFLFIRATILNIF